MSDIIKVNLINKEECANFYERWGKFAAKCYNSNPKYAKRIGKSCHKTGHYSGSRGFYFIFEIEGPRSMIDQLARHEQGVVKNIQSQRYTDSSELEWFVPEDIGKDEDLLALFNGHMEKTKEVYGELEKGLTDRYGYAGEKSREKARGVISMDMQSSGVFGFTIEALENLMKKRLCNRSQEHIRKMAKIMRSELLSVLPELGEYLAPPCALVGVCPEGNMQCSQFKDIFPTKEQFYEIRKHPDYIKMIAEIKKGGKK